MKAVLHCNILLTHFEIMMKTIIFHVYLYFCMPFIYFRFYLALLVRFLALFWYMKKKTFLKQFVYCELNYHNQKIQRILTHDIQKHWTAVSTLLRLISSVYCDLHYWISNQRPQNAEPKFYHRAINPHCTQVMPNQLVMVIAWPINSNVSCKLHPHSLQRTRSPPGPHLPKRIRNTHPCNYYDLKGKDIDVHFLF